MQHWEQTYPMTGPAHVTVDQIDGATRITGWDQPTVQVKASWPGEGRMEDRLEVRVNGNEIILTVKPYRTGFLGLVHDSLLDLEIMVPTGSYAVVDAGSGPVTVENTMGPTEVDGGSGRVMLFRVASAQVDSGSGSVQAQQIAGKIEIETGSGRIDVEAIGGPANLETGSGSIAARRMAGGLQAETGSGSIAAVDIHGHVMLETGSGSIHISRVVAPSMEVETGSGALRMETIDTRGLTLETGSGSVEVELVRIHPGSGYEIETGSGRVTLAVPPDAGLHLEMETRGRVDFGGLNVRVLEQDDDQITAQLNQGGGHMTIESGSGSVTFKPAAVVASEPTEPEIAMTRLAEAVKDDPALEQSDQMSRILRMVEEGKLSTEEAEKLLRALDGEEG